MIVEKILDDNLVLHYSDQKMMMLQVETEKAHKPTDTHTWLNKPGWDV